MNKYIKYKNMTPTEALAAHHNEIMDEFYKEYKHQKELQDMEERLYNRIMKSINIKIVDAASPAIDEIGKQLSNIGGKRR